jgi:hypothetical protein
MAKQLIPEELNELIQEYLTDGGQVCHPYLGCDKQIID